MAKDTKNLPDNTKIDRYVIEKALGGGGFSIVYLAWDIKSKTRVVIKEYMPIKLADRKTGNRVAPISDNHIEPYNKGRKLFFKEASILATLKHPNIVNVINFFQANGTIYIVMEYEEGANLQLYIKSRNGHLSEKFITTVFPFLLDGLLAIHSRGLLHLDIKPSNIHLRPGGRPLLLDFGAVHSMHLDNLFHTGHIITPGFSPIEQYENTGNIGPWSDIYAIGATMRACIEGKSPPAADSRQSKDNLKPAVSAFRKNYAESLLTAIDWAMSMDPKERPQSVSQYINEISTIEDHEQSTKNPLHTIVDSFRWNKAK